MSAAKMSIAHIAADRQYSHFDLYSTNGQGKWEIDFVNLYAFFVERGYFVYKNGSKFEPIRIIDNIVRMVHKKELKDEIINFIIDSKESRHMHQFFLKNISKATSDEFIETLPAKNVEFKKDRKDAMQVYFKNGIVKITTGKIAVFPYSELNGYIWESQIIQRNFNKESLPGSDFKTFCWNISNGEQDRYDSIRSTIGYLIHNYKDPSYSPAVILNDEVISDHPEGGTGKGILIKAVENYIKVLTIEGKTFTFEKNFLYQRVTPETKLICFQDVKKNFDFERLFSVLTEGIVTEKKGKDEIFLDFDDSPKVGITTNYAIRGRGNSHDRRRNELEISQFYNKSKTPYDEFGKMMFKGWDDKDWYEFDAFMIECCQFYLNKGLVEQKLIHLPEKKIIAETSDDFIKFMEGFNFMDTPGKGELYDTFVYEYDEYRHHKWFTKQMFTKWVTAYADFMGFKTEDYVKESIRRFKFSKLQTL